MILSSSFFSHLSHAISRKERRVHSVCLSGEFLAVVFPCLALTAETHVEAGPVLDDFGDMYRLALGNNQTRCFIMSSTC